MQSTLQGAKGKITNLTSINLVVGRNGSGKSRFLRGIAESLRGEPAKYNVVYLSTERGGALTIGNVDQTMRSDPNWAPTTRMNNQSGQFKQVSEAHLRTLESWHSRERSANKVYRETTVESFEEQYLSKMNCLLQNVCIVPDRSPSGGFAFESLEGEAIDPTQLSSGESELFSLVSEVLHFFAHYDSGKTNVLLIDEPDVHLHPDLQSRLAGFLVNEISAQASNGRAFILIVSTHSTPLICALAKSDNTSIGVKHFGVDEVSQRPASAALKKSLPFFGHPLSQVISDDPLLIMEGEDDERVWAQAARSSQGRIRVFPCLSQTVNKQTELERFCADILNAIYDLPKAFSVRDSDGKPGELPDIGPIKRFRLNCYAIENALVTDECLELLGSNWSDFQTKAGEWIKHHPKHSDVDELNELIGSTDRCINKKLKSVRNLVPAILESKKPWEHALGQAIAGLVGKAPTCVMSTSLAHFLGIPFLIALGVLETPQDNDAQTSTEEKTEASPLPPI